MQHVPYSLLEAANRPSIRELVEAYTLAHHITVKGNSRRRMLASLRYNDTCVKQEGSWLFAERLLHVDRVDERALS